jgi:hypothetical protein
MITYEIAKENALKEINEITNNKIKSELVKFKIENSKKLETVIEKILNIHITPVFEEVINKNKIKINEKIKEYEKLSDEDIQFKINEFINSSLSIWKQTVLNSKILFVVKEVITYIKLTNSTEKNYKKKLKQEKQLKKIINKYKL